MKAAFATKRYFPETPVYGVMMCKCSANFNDDLVKQHAAGSVPAKGQTLYRILKLQCNYSCPNLNLLRGFSSPLDTLCTIRTSALEPSDVAPRSSLITYSYGLIERLHSVSSPSIWMPRFHLMDPARFGL